MLTEGLIAKAALDIPGSIKALAELYKAIPPEAKAKVAETIAKGVSVCIGGIGIGVGAKFAIDGVTEATIKIKESEALQKAMTEHPELMPDDVWRTVAQRSKAPKKGIWANGPKKSNAHLYV